MLCFRNAGRIKYTVQGNAHIVQISSWRGSDQALKKTLVETRVGGPYLPEWELVKCRHWVDTIRAWWVTVARDTSIVQRCPVHPTVWNCIFSSELRQFGWMIPNSSEHMDIQPKEVTLEEPLFVLVTAVNVFLQQCWASRHGDFTTTRASYVPFGDGSRYNIVCWKIV